MKILLVQNFYSETLTGGAVTLCRDLRQALRERGHEILVLCAGPMNDQTENVSSKLQHIKPVDDAKELRTLKARIEWLLVSRRNYFITRSVIGSFNPDVVYLHNLEWLTNSPLLAAFDSGKRVVVHAHNHSYEDLWGVKTGKGRYFNNMIFKTGIPSRNVEVIAVSKSIAVGLTQNGSIEKKRIHTIYNGIPEETFKNIDFSSDRPLKAFFAGAISSHKGVHIAIEAVAAARKKGVRLELEIAGLPGNPAYFHQCRQKVKELDALLFVKFTGPLSRDDVWTKLSNALFLLFPSLCEEAFGLIAVEAMANGAIVIGSNRGAIPEVVGDCGFLKEPTPEAFSEAITEVVNMDKTEIARLRLRAFQRAKAMFVLEDRIVEIEKVLSGKTGNKDV